MSLKKFNSEPGFSVGTYPAVDVIDGNANVIANNLSVAGTANLGDVANVVITGGSSGQFIGVDANGTLSFQNVILEPTHSNGPNLSVQYAYGNAFGGDENFTYDPNTGELTATGFIGDGSKLSNIAGANIVGVVANANYAAFANVTLQSLNSNSTTFVIGNNQPNITSVGNLENANVVGNLTSNNIIANSSLLVNGDATFLGNILVQGTAIYSNVQTINVKDPIIQLGGDPFGNALTENDGMDRGSLLRYFTNRPIDAFMGWDNSANQFVLASNVSIVDNTITVQELGNVEAAHFIGNAVGLVNIEGANVVGEVANANYASYSDVANLSSFVTNNVQSNIDTLGTLVSLNVTGAITGSDVILSNSVQAATFFGDGEGLYNIQGSNIVGTVANAEFANLAAAALIASTVTGNIQSNITTVGTLSNLDVSGTVTANFVNVNDTLTATYLNGDGSNVYNVSGSNIVGQVANANYARYAGNAVTVTGNVQTAITRVGTLSNLVVSGNVTAGNVNGGNTVRANYFVGDAGYLGNINAGNVNGTVANAYYADVTLYSETSLVANTVADNSQPNITSVGTLTSLVVSGNASSGNLVVSGRVTAGQVNGNGFGLYNVYGPNVIDTVANANYATYAGQADLANTAIKAGTVTANNQPNITRVGTLANLNVTGSIQANNATLGNAVTANFFIGAGNLLSNIQGPNVTGLVANANYAFYSGNATIANTANVAVTVSASNQPNIRRVGTLANLNVAGPITAGSLLAEGDVEAAFLKGDGGLISNIDGAQVNGIVGYANFALYTGTSLNSGTASNSQTAINVIGGAQPNITSVGTLTGLTVSGNILAENIHVLQDLVVDGNITANGTFNGIFNGVVSGNLAVQGANTGVVYNNDGVMNVSDNVKFDYLANVLSVEGNLNLANGSITRDSKIVPTFVSSQNRPEFPQLGDQWYDIDNDVIYQYIMDAQSNYSWVDISTGFLNASKTAQANTVVVRDANANIVANNLIGSSIVSTAGNVILTLDDSSNVINVNNAKITALATPTAASDAATKNYVDNVAQGLAVKNSVQGATVSALPAYTYDNGTNGVGATITADNNGELVLDGFTVLLNDRVLVKNEIGAKAPYNGIYEYTVAGNVSTAFVLTRTNDYDESSQINGAFTFVERGTALGGTGWVSTNAKDVPTVIGTDNIGFTQFSGTGPGTLTSVVVTGQSYLGDLANVHIDGGDPGTVLKTDGYGNLAWGTVNSYVTSNITNLTAGSDLGFSVDYANATYPGGIFTLYQLGPVSLTANDTWAGGSTSKNQYANYLASTINSQNITLSLNLSNANFTISSIDTITIGSSTITGANITSLGISGSGGTYTILKNKFDTSVQTAASSAVSVSLTTDRGVKNATGVVLTTVAPVAYSVNSITGSFPSSSVAYWNLNQSFNWSISVTGTTASGNLTYSGGAVSTTSLTTTGTLSGTSGSIDSTSSYTITTSDYTGEGLYGYGTWTIPATRTGTVAAATKYYPLFYKITTNNTLPTFTVSDTHNSNTYATGQGANTSTTVSDYLWLAIPNYPANGSSLASHTFKHVFGGFDIVDTPTVTGTQTISANGQSYNYSIYGFSGFTQRSFILTTS